MDKSKKTQENRNKKEREKRMIKNWKKRTEHPIKIDITFINDLIPKSILFGTDFRFKKMEKKCSYIDYFGVAKPSFFYFAKQKLLLVPTGRGFFFYFQTAGVVLSDLPV